MGNSASLTFKRGRKRNGFTAAAVAFFYEITTDLQFVVIVVNMPKKKCLCVFVPVCIYLFPLFHIQTTRVHVFFLSVSDNLLFTQSFNTHLDTMLAVTISNN